MVATRVDEEVLVVVVKGPVTVLVAPVAIVMEEDKNGVDSAAAADAVVVVVVRSAGGFRAGMPTTILDEGKAADQRRRIEGAASQEALLSKSHCSCPSMVLTPDQVSRFPTRSGLELFSRPLLLPYSAKLPVPP